MKNFAKITKLSNVKGRAAYISDPERQENLIYCSDSIDWDPYVRYEKDNRRSADENNQGRELIIALPNEWDSDLSLLKERVKLLSEEAIGKKTDYQYAIHYNKDKTNLHVHIVFSERTKTDEKIKYYDRDIYLKANGQVARSKTERAKDEFGKDLPAIHKKGEIKSGGFSIKDKQYIRKNWLEDTKNKIKEFYRSYGINIEELKEYELHEYHQGKGAESKQIIEKNMIIREHNYRARTAAEKGTSQESLIDYKKDIIKDFKAPMPFIRQLYANFISAYKKRASKLRSKEKIDTTIREVPKRKKEDHER